jgi:hypothetical protein
MATSKPKKEVKKVLVMFNGNWADEMDINGFDLYDEAEWRRVKKIINGYEDDFTLSVGSNEDMEFNTGEDFLNSITVKKLSAAEAKTIDKLFDGSYARGSMADRVLEIIQDNTEEDIN